MRLALVAFVVVAVSAVGPADAGAQRRRTPPRDTGPQTGTLVIQSEQSGAEVLVDEQPVGTTPLDPLELEPGSHTVRVRMPGFTEFTDVVTITRGRSTDVPVELLALSQVLSVVTEPAGARVFVDGTFMGETPVEFDLLEGAHSIRVTHGGYEEVIREVTAQAGHREELSLTLVALPEPPPVDDTEEWFESPVTWLAVGGAAVAIAAAIVIIVVVTSESAASQIDQFCAQPGGCIRVMPGF